MALYRGSRYQEKDMIQGVTAGGESIRFHPLRPTTDTDDTRFYVTKAGDTFESLASKLFGDSNKWWLIADANPEIFYPLDLTSHTQIRIPTAIKASGL